MRNADLASRLEGATAAFYSELITIAAELRAPPVVAPEDQGERERLLARVTYALKVAERTPISGMLNMDEADRVHRIYQGGLKAVAVLRSPALRPAGPVEQTGQERTIEFLRRALDQCGGWFRDYAMMHNEKGDTAKARRNQARADYAFDAVAATLRSGSLEAEPEGVRIEGYAWRQAMDYRYFAFAPRETQDVPDSAKPAVLLLPAASRPEEEKP